MERVSEIGRKEVEDVAQRLERHPAMKLRVARLLDVLENTSGDVRRADDAERRAIEELRAMGQELLEGWGEALAEKEAKQLEAGGGVARQVKKNCTGSAHSERLR